MFGSVQRRLALLAAAVVIAVIAVVGSASYLYLARKIETQTDAELRNRSSSAVQLWSDIYLSALETDGVPSSSFAPPTDDDHDSSSDHGEEDDRDDRVAREVLRSGDTIAYGFDLGGTMIASLRPVSIEHLPKMDSVDRAIGGQIVVETVTIEGARVRLRSEPVLTNGQIIGAIQVGMGLGPTEQVLDFMRMATVGGLLLGMFLAVPSAWFLTRRSMQPIRAAFDRQKAFVADASHELRTPLTLIRAEADYMRRSDRLSEEERLAGETAIIREVDTMAGLVSRLLQLARIDSDSHQLERSKVDIARIAGNVVDRFSGLAALDGVAIRYEGPVHVDVIGDSGAIEQVLTILVENAIRYSTSDSEIVVRITKTVETVETEVEDQGIGIATEDLSRIFDRFYRADPGRDRSVGGAGLGLSIAKELMRAQGGRIDVRSEIGKGSTFTITLHAA